MKSKGTLKKYREMEQYIKELQNESTELQKENEVLQGTIDTAMRTNNDLSKQLDAIDAEREKEKIAERAFQTEMDKRLEEGRKQLHESREVEKGLLATVACLACRLSDKL